MMAGARAKSQVTGGFVFAQIASQLSGCYTRKFISPVHARVNIPGGFLYESFNSKGTVRPWSIIKMVESTRAVTCNPLPGDNRVFLDVYKLYHDYLVFIASTYTRVEPEFYDLSTLKGPVEADTKLTYVGSSSFKNSVSMYFPNFEKPLIENQTTSVIVGKDSRKPMLFPDWWKQKYGAVDGVPLKLQASAVPSDGTWEHETIALPSDTDANGHLNWSSPIKYCLDAFQTVHLQKRGPDNINPFAKNAKEFSVLYKDECSAGDRLKVKFWQEGGNENKYIFHLLGCSSLVSECAVEFYPEGRGSKL